MSTPFAAVTLTTSSFSPVTRSESPTTSNVAAGSVVSTLTSTEVVPGARSTDAPSSTSSPFTWKVDSEVSVFSKTLTVNVYSWLVSPSAATTITAITFAPVTKPVFPTTSTVASWSLVTTSTATSSVPHS